MLGLSNGGAKASRLQVTWICENGMMFCQSLDETWLLSFSMAFHKKQLNHLIRIQNHHRATFKPTRLFTNNPRHTKETTRGCLLSTQFFRFQKGNDWSDGSYQRRISENHCRATTCSQYLDSVYSLDPFLIYLAEKKLTST